MGGLLRSRDRAYVRASSLRRSRPAVLVVPPARGVLVAVGVITALLAGLAVVLDTLARPVPSLALLERAVIVEDRQERTMPAARALAELLLQAPENDGAVPARLVSLRAADVGAEGATAAALVQTEHIAGVARRLDLTLVRGRFPERTLEAMIPEDVALRLGYRLGDEVPLRTGHDLRASLVGLSSGPVPVTLASSSGLPDAASAGAAALVFARDPLALQRLALWTERRLGARYGVRHSGPVGLFASHSTARTSLLTLTSVSLALTALLALLTVQARRRREYADPRWALAIYASALVLGTAIAASALAATGTRADGLGALRAALALTTLPLLAVALAQLLVRAGASRPIGDLVLASVERSTTRVGR